MAHQLQVTGSASLAFMGGSGNVITGADNLGDLFKITIGSNLTLSGGVLSATGGGTGSVTSVGLTTSAGALTITNSPITTSGNIGINFAGTTAQYVRGDGSLATFPTITGYVPYTGATQNLDLGTYGLLTDFVGFNTAPTSIPTTQGTLSWNVDKESLDLIMNGTTGSLMQDTFYNVKNQTGATIPKGTVVRADGTVGASGRIKIAPFKADGTYSSKYCMGVTAEAIADGADGKVLAFGALRKINTSAYVNGDILYASPATAGAFTTTEPSNPNNIVTLAIVVYSDATNGEIFVRPTAVPTQAELIKSLGYTPANDANVVKLTGNQTVGGVKTFSSESIFDGGITLTGGDIVLKSGDFNTTLNTDTLTESRSILFPDNSGTVALLTDIDYPVTSVFGRTGDVVAESGDYDTDMVDEGTTNLYYTNARARGAVSANTGSALTYNSTTGKFTLVAAESGVDGYLTGADWDYFDGKQNSLGTGTTSQFLRGDLVWAAPPTPALEDLTDVGITSPTNGQLLRYQVGTWVNWTPNYVSATYFSATAPLSYNSGTGVFSISQATTSTNGYLSSTDWNTFNNKQDALTNPVTGTGASGYIAKWNTASTITNSLIYEASSKVGINTTNMVSLFDVTKNALGVTVVDTSGITLKNETEAITGNQQISPALHFKSNGWNNLDSASQSADWIEYSLPIQGNAVTSNLIWASSINGAAYTTRFTLSSAGNGTFTGTLAASNLSGTNTGDVTIGTGNGLSLSGQAISLALASTSTTGALSSTDWNTFNGKQAAITLTTTGSSGSSTFVSNTLNIPTYTLAGLGGQPQLNGTGFVKASGTTISYDNTSYLPLTGGTLTGALGGTSANFSSPTTIGDNSGNVMLYVGTSAASPRTYPTAIQLDNTYLNSAGVTTALKFYLYKNGTETYGFGLNNASGVEYHTAGIHQFYTASGGSASVKAMITNGGNFLINTTTDAGYKLDVNGSGRFNNNVVIEANQTSNPLFYAKQTGTSGYTAIQFSGNNGTDIGALTTYGGEIYIGSWNGGNGSSGQLRINKTTGAATFSSDIQGGGDLYFNKATRTTIYPTTTNQNLHMKSNGSGVLQFNNDNTGNLTMCVGGGNVGIGTSSPSDLLSVVGSGLYPRITIQSTNAGSSAAGINFADNSATQWAIAYDKAGGGMQFYKEGSGNKMYITNAGNVGIGTSSPASFTNFTTLTINNAVQGGVLQLQSNGTNALQVSCNATESYIFEYRNNPLIFATNSTERMRIRSDGNTTIGFTDGYSNIRLNVRGVDTTSSNYTLHAETTSGSNFWVRNDGVSYLKGNVLIGTTTDAGYKIYAYSSAFYFGNDNGATASPSYIHTGNNYSNGETRDKCKIYFYNSGNEKYGIGVGSAGDIQYHSNAYHRFYISNTKYFEITSSITASTSITATGFFESSDKRLKEELDSNALIDDISKIKAKLYLKEGKKEIGYYAQDLEEIMPYAVSEGGDKYLTLSYSQVHTAKIAKLEAELAELKEIVKNLIK